MRRQVCEGSGLRRRSPIDNN
ncbi:MAG: hypothetical protein J7L22_01075 [Candidatus Marinimicrobia bacterium]|nr:hypothetical protein [Candidatus Neomarinimicrobiota bacterium]